MRLDENKELMRRWHGEMNKHNAGACEVFLADTYTETNNMTPGPLDKAGAKALLDALFVAIPDMHREIVEQTAEGDRVVERLRYSGTQQGEMFGIPATGKQATFDAVMTSRIEDGKIVEIWALLDSMSLMQQLGVVPRP